MLTTSAVSPPWQRRHFSFFMYERDCCAHLHFPHSGPIDVAVQRSTAHASIAAWPSKHALS